MEAIALIADIHANLLAAEAVHRRIFIESTEPDRIVSLGDQVNLGPAPRDTLRLLRAEGVTCLHGNHEGYILSAMTQRTKVCRRELRFAPLQCRPLLNPARNHLSKGADRYSGVTLLPRPAGGRPLSRAMTRRSRFPACNEKAYRARHAHRLRPRPQPSCTTVCRT